MDIFKFLNPNHPTKMEQGVFINGIVKKMWIERYNKAGEFSFSAGVSSGLRDQLPIGSFVSHTDTHEIMIVENHEIVDDGDNEPQITVTGRGLESFLENIIIRSGMFTNGASSGSSGQADWVTPADYPFNQAVHTIREHIGWRGSGFLLSGVQDAGNEVRYISPYTSLVGTGPVVARSIQIGTVYERVLELLAGDWTIGFDLGIKSVRPGPWSPFPVGSTMFIYDPIDGSIDIEAGSTALLVHTGFDLRKQVFFSESLGQIEKADYLWSSKALKNYALIKGRWIVTAYVGTATGIDRRMMIVDASDIDQGYAAAPGSPAFENLIVAFRARAADVLRSQKSVAISNVEIKKNVSGAIYRKDFDIGDLVTVVGDYDTSTAARVSEYVEIEDETGTTKYPTLTVLT